MVYLVIMIIQTYIEEKREFPFLIIYLSTVINIALVVIPITGCVLLDLKSYHIMNEILPHPLHYQRTRLDLALVLFGQASKKNWSLKEKIPHFCMMATRVLPFTTQLPTFGIRNQTVLPENQTIRKFGFPCEDHIKPDSVQLRKMLMFAKISTIFLWWSHYWIKSSFEFPVLLSSIVTD